MATKRRPSLRRRFLVDNLDLEEASGVEGARWEAFQIALFDDEGTFRIDNKSRQIAFSFACAADGLADAILTGRDAIFVSINQEEAAEKVRYARAIYEALQVSGLPRIVRNRTFGLELSNGARLDSLPARPPRGRARSNIYMDEFAHVKGDANIYRAALPIISKGGRLRMGSSPMGAGGTFWEICEQKMRPYPGYARRSTPWWETYSFCTNVREARRVAPTLLTQERVERYGNRRIREIYENIPETDFQQEYECAFLDESTAWITWEEIRQAQDEELICYRAQVRGNNIELAREAVDDLLQMVHGGLVEPAFAAGVDIGRTRNTTEIFLVGLTTTNTYPLRLMISLGDVKFDDQLDVLKYVMYRLPVARMLIDRNGIGMSLAEAMERAYPGKAEGQNFTSATKLLWSTDVKKLIQQGKVSIPVDRDLAYQIHSIKRMKTANNNLIFDTDANEKHHADQYWAWALALAGGHGPVSDRARVARAR